MLADHKAYSTLGLLVVKFKRVIGIQKKISMRVQQEIEEDKVRPILAEIAKPIWLQEDAKRGGWDEIVTHIGTDCQKLGLPYLALTSSCKRGGFHKKV